MPAIPSTFRGRTGPTKPFSHERLLTVCYAYKTLYEKYVAAGGEVDSAIYSTSLEIEREIIFWEQRSAKLRYEAGRQAARRAATKQRAKGDNLVSPDAVSSDFGDYAADDNDLVADLPASTKATLDQFKASHGVAPDATSAAAFDRSNYKKSGLI